VEAIRFGQPVELESGGETERYDLVVLAIGVNGRLPLLQGCSYRPPPLGAMCQTELYLGADEVERRLGCSVQIFLVPDEIAIYGILIPKGPFVTVSLLNARGGMRSLHQFLELDQVRAVLGPTPRPVCGCQPRISVGPARGIVDDGLVAIGDAGTTRLYKNGIGSALATAERAARTAITSGHRKLDFVASYLPLCRAIDRDNQAGRMLFWQVPMLKHIPTLSMAHHRLAAGGEQHRNVSELHGRILWGMFTGTQSYRRLLGMALSPELLIQLALALGNSGPGQASRGQT
jgi:flavin-dependent dehydrogenase